MYQQSNRPQTLVYVYPNIKQNRQTALLIFDRSSVENSAIGSGSFTETHYQSTFSLGETFDEVVR